MESILKVAVIGLGHWGPNLVRAIQSHDRAKVIAGVEASESRRAFVAEKLPGLPLYASFEDCLAAEKLDAVVVAVPTQYHHQVGMQALNAGLHVMLEKPLAHTAAAAQELVDTAEAKGLTLMTGHIFLYNDAVLEMRRVIQDGELGNVFYIRSVRTNLGPIRQDVNALWDLASHDIAIFNYLFDALPIEVSCTNHSLLGLRQEDITSASIMYPGNRVGILFSSWLDPLKRRDITVVGESKMLTFDDMVPQKPLRIYDKGVVLNKAEDYVDNFQAFRLSVREGQMFEPEVTTGEPLKAECQHFVDCVLENKRPFTDGQNGVEVVKVLEALTRSALERGQPVNLWESKIQKLAAVGE